MGFHLQSAACRRGGLWWGPHCVSSSPGVACAVWSYPFAYASLMPPSSSALKKWMAWLVARNTNDFAAICALVRWRFPLQDVPLLSQRYDHRGKTAAFPSRFSLSVSFGEIFGHTYNFPLLYTPYPCAVPIICLLRTTLLHLRLDTLTKWYHIMEKTSCYRNHFWQVSCSCPFSVGMRK